MELIEAIVSVLSKYFIIGLIGFVIYKLATPKNSPDDNKSVSINDIRRAKASGITSIDQLIQYFVDKRMGRVASSVTPIQSQAPIMSPTQSSTVIPTSQNIDTTLQVAKVEIPKVVEKKSSDPADSSKVLLYTGSALVTFAMLVLVTLGWNSMSEILKVVLLFANVVGFLVTGLYLLNNEKLKGVGSTFLFVGSLGFMLLMLGLWNFILADLLVGYEFVYWVFVSIFSTMLNALLYVKVKEDRFFNLGIFSLYNIIFSLAYTISVDTNLRIVWLVVFNTLVLLIPKNLFESKNYISILTVTRWVNIVGSIAIMFVVFGFLGDALSTFDKYTILFALVLPVFHSVYDYVVNKANFIVAEIIMLVPKVLLISSIFDFSVDGVIVLLAMVVGLYTLLSEFVFKRNSNGYTTSKVMSYFVGGYLALTGFYFIFSRDTSTFDGLCVLISSSIALAALLFAPLKVRDSKTVGFLSISLLMIIAIFLKVIAPDLSSEVYSYIFMLIAFTLGIGVNYITMVDKQVAKELMNPTFYISLALSFLVGFSYTLNAVGNDFLLFLSLLFGITTALFVIKYLLERFITYKFIAYIAGIFAIFFIGNFIYAEFSLDKLFDYNWVSVIFLLPIVGFWATFEFSSSQNKSAEITGYILSIAIAVMIASALPAALILVVTIVSLISAYRVFINGSKLESFILPLLIFANITLFNEIVTIGVDGIFALVGIAYLGFTFVIRTVNNKKLLGNFEVALNITNGFLLMQHGLWMIGTEITLIYTIGLLAFASAMMLSRNRIIQKLSGIPLVLIIWGLLNEIDVNIQFYIVPVTVYLLTVAWIFKQESDVKSFELIRNIALAFQLLSLLMQTVSSSSENVAIISGLVLILLSTIFLILAVVYQDNNVKIMSLVFLALGLFVRLLFVIVLIPWWMYLAILGLALIGFAVYRIAKSK